MSTNKTEKLNLHSWVEDDYVLREEFNENFAALDATQTRFKLAEINITENCDEIEIDFSDIDFSDWDYVEIYAKPVCVATSAYVYIYVNNIKTSSYTYTDYNSSQMSGTESCMFAFTSYGSSNATANNYLKHAISCHSKPVTIKTELESNKYRSKISSLSSVSNISSFNYVFSSATNSFAAGTKFIIYGEKI